MFETLVHLRDSAGHKACNSLHGVTLTVIFQISYSTVSVNISVFIFDLCSIFIVIWIEAKFLPYIFYYIINVFIIISVKLNNSNVYNKIFRNVPFSF